MNQSKPMLYLSLGVTAALTVGTAFAQHAMGHNAAGQEPKTLPMCPVTNEPVDFNVSTTTADGPVYFCCPGCIKTLQKDPAKYADKVAAQRAALAKMPRIQVTCAIDDQAIDKNAFIEQGGKQIYFCCDNCKAKYEADPAKYKAQLAASYTYQTHCPVKGGEIDPAVSTKLPTGQRVFFCCKGCEGKFLKNPAEYAPKLAAQGYPVDIEKLQAAEHKQEPAHEHP